MTSRHHTVPQFMQKKSPLYVMLKEDTVWSMDHLNRYINDKFRKTKGLPRDWVFTTFTVRVLLTHRSWGGKGQDPLGYVRGQGSVSACTGLGTWHVRRPWGVHLYGRACLSACVTAGCGCWLL